MLSSLRLPQVPNMPPPRVLPGKGSGGGGGGSGSGGGSPDKLPRGLSKKQSRTISQRFIRAPLYDISQFVWIEEEERVWILCTILKQDNTVLMLQDVESAVVYKIDIGFDELKLCNEGLVSDMSKMQHIHEPAILYNLSRRFLQRHEYYTYAGRNVLVSMNPMTWEYPDVKIEDYFSCSVSTCAPHPYVFTEEAYQCVCTSTHSHPKNRSIVISGDSGAGKTETAKLVLHYLAVRAGASVPGSLKEGDGTFPRTAFMSHAILQTSHILEAFGNSKTVHNPNSSRFGRYIKIVFDSNDEHGTAATLTKKEILGAKHEIYLLEKGRVLGQVHGEQNFHIFYQYLSGVVNGSLELGDLARSVHNLNDLDGFRLLNSCDSLDVMYDKFQETQNALGDIMSDASIAELWNIIGGILHLGNIEFVENETPEGNAAYISGLTSLQSACTLLDVSWKEMRNLMTQKVIETRDERFVVPLTHEGAVATRDAICKSIYDTLFHDIVSNINESLSGEKVLDGRPFIGVLDLFGFETMDVNGFAQFMINYANEAMQSCFNKFVLHTELNLYEEENIPCALTIKDCPNNIGCLELITSRGVSTKSNSLGSILSILDSVCQQPMGSDEIFCETMHKTLSDHSNSEDVSQHFLYTHPKDRRHQFKVKHYAGNVTYTVQNSKGRGSIVDDDDQRTGWVESNKDAVPCALDDIMTSSGNSLLQKFRTLTSRNVSVASNTNILSRQKLRMKSVATTFSTSICDLCALLESTECTFIRCIKPNHSMSAGEVDNTCVVNQIRSLALVQTSLVNQVGLRKHLSVSFTSIVGYISTNLCSKVEYRHLLAYTSDALVSSWLIACGIPKHLFSIGKTKVFFREGFHEHLDVHHSMVWADEDDLIRLLSGLNPHHNVVEKIHDILHARKQRQMVCAEYKLRVESYSSMLIEVKAYLQSDQSPTFKVPTISPFTYFFKRADEANICLEAAHFQAEVVNSRLNSLEAAISTSVAPPDEAILIKSEIMEKVTSFRTMLTLLPYHVTTINSYESKIRTGVSQAQEEVSDIAMKHWDSISLADKYLESVTDLLNQLDDANEEGGTIVDDIMKNLDYELDALSLLFSEKMPNPEEEEVPNEKWKSLWKCEDSMVRLADEVIVKGKDVEEQCAVVLQQCLEAEEELVEAKNTLSFFEKATRAILHRVSENEELNGDGHGLLHPCISESTADDDNETDSKSNTLSASHSVSFCDEGELDDDISQTSRSVKSMMSMASLGQGKRLTAKSLRVIQRGISAVSALSGGADSSVHSFSFETEESDDDDILSVIDMDFWIIPNGWEEYFDTDTQNSYYLNTITQTTQWERPQEPAEGTAGSVTWADDIIIDSTVAGVEDAEKISSDEKRSDAKDDDDSKLPAKQWFNDLSPIAEGKFQHPIAEEKLVSHKNDYTEYNIDTKKISESKVDHDDGISDASSGCISPAISIKSATSKCNLNYGRVTTAQLDMLSTLPKDGHLMKQSASFFSSRWNRKYFVLNGLRLECYEKSEDYFYGLHKPVVMGLTLSTCTSFTDDANTFVVKTTDDAGHTVAWTLAAPNHTEKNEWVTYINAHVYTHHCQKFTNLQTETALDRRLISATRKSPRRSLSFDEGDTGTVTFWQLLQPENQRTGQRGSRQVLPVGIRTLPDINSSRTGEGIFPGEHVEVVSTREDGNLTFLQLADDRGWVFSLNPKSGSSLFVPAVGYSYRLQRGLQFQVSDTETDGVPIQYNPGDCSPFTGEYLRPTEVVPTTASFVLDTDLKHSLFVKLADGRGWVNTRGKYGGIGMKALNNH